MNYHLEFYIQNWFTLSNDQKILALQTAGYEIIDNGIISYKAVRKDGHDMGFAYCYDLIGKIYIDEDYNEKEFANPGPHTAGGIWSSSFKWQMERNPNNKNNTLNHYVKLSSKLEDIRLCYDLAIKNSQIKLLEIQGSNLHL